MNEFRAHPVADQWPQNTHIDQWLMCLSPQRQPNPVHLDSFRWISSVSHYARCPGQSIDVRWVSQNESIKKQNKIRVTRVGSFNFHFYFDRNKSIWLCNLFLDFYFFALNEPKPSHRWSIGVLCAVMAKNFFSTLHARFIAASNCSTYHVVRVIFSSHSNSNWRKKKKKRKIPRAKMQERMIGT